MKKLIFYSCLLLISISASAQVPSYVPSIGLVGWWPFNGNANDESGNGNNGIVNGATLTNDRFGEANRAFSFDGIDDYILTNYYGVENDNSRTFSFWVLNNSATQKVIMSYGTNDTSRTYFNIWTGYNCGGISVDISHSAITYNSSLNNPNWNHYVIVLNKSIGSNVSNLLFYENGALLNSICNLYYDSLINTLKSFPLTFGKYHAANTNYFTGKIDDVGIWNRALTQSEITSLYNQTTNSNIPSYVPTNGLVGYWPFNGNANDESGNGNNFNINSATISNDRNNQSYSAYYFNGQQYMEVTSPSFTLSPNSSFSISAWVKPDVNGECALTSGTTESGNFVLGLWGASNGASFGAALQQGPWIGANSIVGISQWTNLTAVFDSSNLKLYKNGNLISSANYNYGGNPKNMPFRLGCDHAVNNKSRGFIDDIGIWQRALTQSEIIALYNAISTNIEVGLLNNIKIYPNPSNDFINIEGLNKNENTVIKLYDLQGKLILSSEVKEKGSIDISELNNGVYVILIGDMTHKIIKM